MHVMHTRGAKANVHIRYAAAFLIASSPNHIMSDTFIAILPVLVSSVLRHICAIDPQPLSPANLAACDKM